MTKEEIVEIFKKFDFRDGDGTPLTDSDDFIVLAEAAATGGRLELRSKEGTTISPAWLDSLQEEIMSPSRP